MWRLPNRRRSDTGRYKVPISTREALHKPYADMEAITLRPRKGHFWVPEEDLSPCHALVKVSQHGMANFEQAIPLSTCRHEGGRIVEGQRNATLAGLAGAMRRRGVSDEAIAAALMVENRRRCDPPLSDETRVPGQPPRDVCESILAMPPHRAFPRLASIRSVPIMLPGRRLLA